MERFEFRFVKPEIASAPAPAPASTWSTHSGGAAAYTDWYWASYTDLASTYTRVYQRYSNIGNYADSRTTVVQGIKEIWCAD